MRTGRKSRGGAAIGAALAVCALALGVVASSGAARAQLSPSSSKGPIDITSDEAEAFNAQCSTVWRGSAEALQGDSRLRAASITAYLKKKGVGANGQPDCGATERIEADGDVFYVTPTQIARADHAVYTADSNQILMTGNVIVVQGQDVVRGDRMTIDTVTREVHVDSAAKGRGTPGRVRGVFYPNQPGEPTAPPPASR